MSANPDETLAPAAYAPEREEVQTVSPIVMWDKDFVPEAEHNLYDFRPRPELEEPEAVEEQEVPKGSSAPASALAAIYETVKMPDLKARLETTASVETETTKEPGSENGQPTSSSTDPTTDGSSKQPA